MLKFRSRALISFLLAAWLCQAIKSQTLPDGASKVNSDAILSQSGLQLGRDVTDLLALAERQSHEEHCEVLSVKWISLPGAAAAPKPAPASDAEKWPLPYSFSVETRRDISSCGRNSYRTDFLYFGLVVFGTTKEGKILGVHLDSDPRSMNVECPELFGGKSTPVTKCGIFVEPYVVAEIHMPRDPELTRLVFYLRKMDRSSMWHLVRVGAVNLAPQ